VFGMISVFKIGNSFLRGVAGVVAPGCVAPGVVAAGCTAVVTPGCTGVVAPGCVTPGVE